MFSSFLFKTFQQYIQIFCSLHSVETARRSLAYNLFLVYNKGDIVINKPHLIEIALRVNYVAKPKSFFFVSEWANVSGGE